GGQVGGDLRGVVQDRRVLRAAGAVLDVAPVVADADQPSAGGQRAHRVRQDPAPLLGGQVQVGQEHQVVAAGFGGVGADVGRGPFDVGAAFGGDAAAPLHRHRGEVD